MRARHSPLPWTLVRHPTPYGDWIMDAEGGVVCLGFARTDEAVLLHAADLLAAVEAALVALDAGRIVRARRILADALASL